VFTYTGSTRQQQIARDAVDLFDFPWERMTHNLALEGKDTIEITWQDLTRYNQQVAHTRAAGDGGHSHIHIPVGGGQSATAHPIERVIEGRKRVLGLFYLPPYTRVVIETSLVSDPELAAEVIGCELAHAVDYHTFTPRDRWEIVNILHTDDLVAGADTSDGAVFHLDGHTCSWFDVGPYEAWVGEAFMETFVEAFGGITATMSLMHPTGPDQAAAVRQLLLPTEPDDPDPDTPEPVDHDADLEAAIAQAQAALRKYEDNRQPAKYVVVALRDLSQAADAWWRARGGRR
jgi:hypothetical protein